MSIKTNEREIAGKVADWINDRINTGGYPFTEATNETGLKIDTKTRFGDVIIWQNREAKEAYSYIEIKPPFGAKENLETFRQKATKLKVKYAFTWDFQNLDIYRVDGNEIHPHDSIARPLLNKLDEWLRGDKQAEIKAFIHWLCDEIEKLNQTGKLSRFSPEKVYFINLIRDTKDKLIPEFEQFIKEQQRKSTNKSLIDKYVVEQGISMPNDEAYYKIIASQRVYGLITKVIFYLTVRKYFQDLPDLIDAEENDLNRSIKLAFAKAAEKDWQAVFLDDPIEELGIPQTAEIYLKHFFQELKVYHFANLKEDVIGELFEEIIDPNDRHNLGQYFTREDLVDFVIGTVVDDANGVYSDPTCGSGTFLIRLYDRIKYLKRSKKHEEILDQIWGIDIGKFPAELSTINLFRQQANNFENFPRVLNKSIFDIHKGYTSDFPPPNAGKNYKKIKIPFPEINAFVGNFPFIRQELIEKKAKGFKDELTFLLAEEYLFSYPKLFVLKNISEENISYIKNQKPEKQKKQIQDWIKGKSLQLKLSGQADIYAYIYIHTATLLADNGKFAIITSNSWLDASYGSVMKELFLDNFNVKMVVASWAEPWFEDAAVNTIVTVLEKKSVNKKEEDHLVKFVKLKQKFEVLIPQHDLQLESIKRWERIDALVREIDNAQYKKGNEKITNVISSYETDEMRIRIVPQTELVKEVAEKGEMSKWGKFLRAPNVYFELIDECKDKLVPIKKIANVRFGIKTGINDFFYLEKVREDKNGNIIYKNVRGWEGLIEAEFLREVVKSPREIDCVKIDKKKLKHSIFICGKTKAELKKGKYDNALKYIEWGEKQKTKDSQNTSAGISWPEVESVKSRKNWYDIGINEFSNFMWPKSFNNRFCFPINNNLLVADRLYELTIKDKKKKAEYSKSFPFLLNCTIQTLFVEVNGRMNLGEGALDNMTYEAEDCYVINPKIKINHSSKFLERKILSVFEEVKQKDRKELDTAVLEALGMDAKEWLPKIYAGLCEMVKERLDLPKMRKKQKKDKVAFSYEEVKRSVIRDVLGSSKKPFPDRFYDGKKDYNSLVFESHPYSGRNLKMESFFDQHIVKDEDDDVVFETESRAKAQFACIIVKNNRSYSIKIPKDEKVCEKIIASYEAHVAELNKMLVANANMKLHDWAFAEKMTKEILNDKGFL
ncbi:MAG: N-6 DNA methylase [Bacteroidia bacterium]